jgi:hypothetical protein
VLYRTALSSTVVWRSIGYGSVPSRTVLIPTASFRYPVIKSSHSFHVFDGHRGEFGAEAISSPSMPVVTTPTLPREVSGITPREATSREGTDMDFLSVSSPQDEDRVRKVGSQVSRASRMIEDSGEIVTACQR